MNKDKNNRQAKINGGKNIRPQTLQTTTVNKETLSWENLLQDKAHQLIIQYQMVSAESIQTRTELIQFENMDR